MDLQSRLLSGANTFYYNVNQNRGVDGRPPGVCKGWGWVERECLALRLPLLMSVDLHGLP